MNIWNRHDRIPEIYGLIIASGLIVFFLLMHITGYVHVIELRLLNIFIMLGGVYYSLKQFRRTHNGELNYFRALITGVAAATIGSAIFALFLFFYLKVDSDLMQAIIVEEPMGRFLNPYIAAAIVMLEGIFSGLTMTYLLINYIPTDQVSNPITDSINPNKDTIKVKA